MGFAAPLAMIVGGGLSAASQWAGGDAAYAAGNANAEVRENQARYTEETIGSDVEAHRRQFRTFMGGLRGDIAAQGGLATEGTGLLMAQEAAVASKLDELNIITEKLNQASALRTGASFARAEGSAARTQARLGALGSAIGSFGRAAQTAGWGAGGGGATA